MKHSQQPRKTFSGILSGTTLAAIIAMVMLVSVTAPVAYAQTYVNLATFTGNNGTNPNPRLVADAAGNLYGTTFYGGYGGAFGPGTVFKLTHHSYGWALTTLYEFHGHADGLQPWGGVVFGPDGALYGETYQGGTYGYGVVYKLQPRASACRTAPCFWQETVLYNFTGGNDGGDPQGDLAFDSAGNLYGTTLNGGPGQNYGVVYRLTPSHGMWSESTVHAFNSADGSHPIDGVVLDAAGNLYGLTDAGGAHSLGGVYELSYGVSGWTETVLHDFAGGSDGTDPAGLTIDGAGNVYGETGGGGANNYGTVYQLQAVNGGFNYSIIYNYNSQSGNPVPVTSLTADSAGNLYGCNVSAGPNVFGVAFKLTPAQGSWNFTLLYNFSEDQGYQMNAKPLLDSQGNIYGVASSAGGDYDGSAWEITP